MAATTRGGSRAGTRRRSSSRNNQRNQSSSFTSKARQSPFATAAAVAGAVAAGVFLWSRRNEVSDHIGNLTDQFGDWRERLGGSGEGNGSDQSPASSSAAQSDDRTQVEIAQEALTLKQLGETA
jgi:hypothetical protein